MSHSVPAQPLPLDADILKDLVQTAVAECEHTLMKLQVQHTKLQQHALNALVDGVAKAYAARARAKKSDRENTSPTTVNSSHPATPISSAGNSCSSEWVVETVLPNSARFRTVEPPPLDATSDSPVPRLDMATIVPELTGELTPDGPISQAQARMAMTPSFTTSSISTESESCDFGQFDLDEKAGDKPDEHFEAPLKLPSSFREDSQVQRVFAPPEFRQLPDAEPSAHQECAKLPLEMIHVCECGWVYEDNAKFCSKCGAHRTQASSDRIADSGPLDLDESTPVEPLVVPPVSQIPSATAKTAKKSKVISNSSRPAMQASVVKVGKNKQIQRPISKDAQQSAMKLNVHRRPPIPITEGSETVADGSYALVGSITPPSSPEAGRQRADNREASCGFDAAVGLLIIMSATSVGIEASDVAAGQAMAVVRAAQVLVLLGFVLELSVRLRALGVRAALRSPWMALDLLAILGGWLHVVMQLSFGSISLRPLCVLLLIRLVRLPSLTFRLFRSAASPAISPVEEQLQFESILAGVLPFILVAAVAFAGLLYVWAVLGVHVIQSDVDFGEDYKATADAYFGSLGRSILTLVSALSLDGIAVICTPLVVARPALALYFGAFLLLGSIVSVGAFAGAVAQVLSCGGPKGSPDGDTEQREKMAVVEHLQNLLEYVDIADRLEGIEDSVRDLAVRSLAYPALLFPEFEQRDQRSPDDQETLEI